MEQKRNFGICLGSGPAHTNSNLAVRLANAAINCGIGVRIFLFDDGIYNALRTNSIKNNIGPFQKMTDKGVEISTCVEMAKFRGVTKENASERIEFVSLIMFSNLIATCDKTILLLQ